MAIYKGNKVTIVRDAGEGDTGYVAGVEQVIIRTEEGEEEAVPKDLVTESE